MSDIKTAIEAFEAIVKAADHAMYYPELEKLANIVRPILFDAQKVRDEVIEECAKACEEVVAYNTYDPCSTFAKSVRLVKSSPAQPVAHYEEQPDGTITQVDPTAAPTTLEAPQDQDKPREPNDAYKVRRAAVLVHQFVPLNVGGDYEKEMLQREIHNLKRHIEDYCKPASKGDAGVKAWLVPQLISFKGARKTSCPIELQPQIEGTVGWGAEMFCDIDFVEDKFGVKHKPLPLVLQSPSKPQLSDEAEEATDEMIDAACDAVPDLYRVDAMRAIEAALLVRQSSERDNDDSTAFYWLVELRPAFAHHPNFAATYYAGWMKSPMDAAKTYDVHASPKFTRKEDAEHLAEKLGGTLSCVWQAIEHGFSGDISDPAIAASATTKEGA